MKIIAMASLIATLLVCLGQIGYADDQAKDSSVSQPLNTTDDDSHLQAVGSKSTQDKQVKASAYEVITFKAGSSDLTESDKTSLRRLADKVGAAAINQIHVAAWSDQPFPQNTDLDKAARALASERIDKISSFIKNDLKLRSVASYNMAERSNWLARRLNTRDAELKSLFGQRGKQPVSREDFDTIKLHGGPMKAVVVAQEKEVSAMKGDTSDRNY